MNFTKEELLFILSIMNQLNFKPGQSKMMFMAEDLINKISDHLKIKEEVNHANCNQKNS
jgi:hypothetical protein